MPPLLICLLLFVPVCLAFAMIVGDARDRSFLFGRILCVWAILGPFTALVNDWLPFAGGGDDERYYYLSDSPAGSIAEAFDMTRFAEEMEQPGYPWALSLIGAVTGHDLLVYKMSNLCILILIGLTWYRIATLLEGPEFGRVVATCTWLLTPLWYYVFFLLKDLTIALMQSLFVLGLVHQWRRSALGPWLLIGASTLSLLPFRTFLVLSNTAVIACALMLRLLAREQGRRGAGRLAAGAVLTSAILMLGSNPEILSALGVYTEHRVIGSDAMVEIAGKIQSDSQMNRLLFPLLYLLSETQGLNPESWQRLNAGWLRGIVAVPWIFLVVPFFVLGVRWAFQTPNEPGTRLAAGAGIRSSRAASTPWGVLLLFVLSTLALSWQLGDTTRWRISDMPVIAAIAAAGWTFAAPRLRRQVLLGWATGATLLFVLFYLLK